MSAIRLLRVIAANEVKAVFRQRSVYLLGALVAGLLLAAGALGARRAHDQAAERQRYQDLVRQQWESQPDRHPHRVAHFGSFAFRPVGRLAAFDFGVDSFTGTAVYQEAHRQNTANFSEAGHASSMLRFGQLSMAMVLQTIVPLLIVFWGFASVAGERERGGLGLIAAQGVSLRTLALGRMLGVLATLAIVLLPAAILSGLLIRLAGPASMQPDAGPRLALLVTVYAGYFGLWAAITVGLSARAATSRGALAAGLCLWVAMVVVLPRAAAALGTALHPAPARIELDAAVDGEVRQTGDSHNPNDPKFQELQRDLLTRHGASRVEDLPLNFGGVVMKTAEELSARIYQRHFDDLTQIYARQDRFQQAAALVSPFVALRSLSMALAGTSSNDYLSFLRQSEQNRYQIVQALNELHTHQIRYQDDRAQKVSRRHWQEIPMFQGRPSDLASSLRPERWSALCLLMWVLLVGGLSPIALPRTRIT